MNAAFRPLQSESLPFCIAVIVQCSNLDIPAPFSCDSPLFSTKDTCARTCLVSESFQQMSVFILGKTQSPE